MKSGKKVFIFTEAVLAVLVLLVIVLMLRENKEQEMPKISVLIQNSEDEQWAAFRYGLRMAAIDNQCELFIVSTGEDMTLEEQIRMAENEIESGGNALIIQPLAGEDATERLKKIEKRAPIVYVEETPEKGSNAKVLVELDNYDMGVTLAEEVIKDYDGNMTGKTIGIVGGEKDSVSFQRREEGFRHTIEEAGGRMIWGLCRNERGEITPEKQPEADIVAALDDDSLTKAGAAASVRKLHGAVVYGIGRSTEAIYYLDTGAAECVIVSDEFNTGYRSLTVAAKKAGVRIHKSQEKPISYTVLRRDTLFSEENQEILFTMSQ